MSFCFLSPVRRPIVACFTEPVGTLLFVGRCVSRWRPCTDMQQPRQQHMTHMHHAVTFSRHLSKPPQTPHSIQHHMARRPLSFNTSGLRSINWKLTAASLPQQLSIPSQYSSSSTYAFKRPALARNLTFTLLHRQHEEHENTASRSWSREVLLSELSYIGRFGHQWNQSFLAAPSR